MKKYRRIMSHETEEWSKEKLILEKYTFFMWRNRLAGHVREKFSNLWSSHYYKMHWFEAFLLMSLKTRPQVLVITPYKQKESTHSPRQHSFKNVFPLTAERGRGGKIQSENLKMTWNIRFFIFCMIWNFFKYDGFIVLQIISILEYGIDFVASPLEPW